MAYNPYGHHPPYGSRPGAYPGYPGGGPMPDMNAPPGLGPPPGMSPAPGMAPPPGIQQPSPAQANRPSGLPPAFHPPPNLPNNINFNAPVIRLGTLSAGPPAPAHTAAAASKPPTGPGARHHYYYDSPATAGDRGDRGGGRPDHRGGERGDRAAARDAVLALVPLSLDEKLRTLFIHKIPEGVDNAGIEKILGAVGALRRWDPVTSVLEGSRGLRFGVALFEDAESLANAAELLPGVEIPVAKQAPTPEGPEGKDHTFAGIEKTKLLQTIDPKSQKYIDRHKEKREADGGKKLQEARDNLKRVLLDLFYPRSTAAASKDADGDTAMGEGNAGGPVEVVNIPLAQEDELADIPAEMREIVAAEIAAFRERSNRRDMERIKQEEEMEVRERQKYNANRPSRLDSPPASASAPAPAGGVNSIPVKSRAVTNAPSGPKGQNGRVAFVNGSSNEPGVAREEEDDDTDASDGEVWRRHASRQRAEEEKAFLEAERKWANRERSRAAAIARETEREAQVAEHYERAHKEQLERDRAWDEEREAARKNHIYYRDHAAWLRKRMHDRAEEERRDADDRRAEEEELRRARADMERARGMADSFLDQQAQELEQRERRAETAERDATPTSATAPQQPFTLSFGAAAARAQRSLPQRRTIAEVEGLLDDEEASEGTKLTLVPIQFEPTAAAERADMSEEEVSAAVRALAAEIPSDKEGLWAWKVSWDHAQDGAIIRDKLRPFVEKKIMEYLGVQEEMLVNVAEDYLKRQCKPSELVDELAEALDDEAEDLVKKLWRMLIFFTECEKRGLPT